MKQMHCLLMAAAALTSILIYVNKTSGTHLVHTILNGARVIYLFDFNCQQGWNDVRHSNLNSYETFKVQSKHNLVTLVANKETCEIGPSGSISEAFKSS